MKFYKIIYIACISLVSCKTTVGTSSKSHAMDIKSIKWIQSNDNEMMSWYNVIMPIILDFDDDTIHINFSGYEYRAWLENNNLYIGDNQNFQIVKMTSTELILKRNDFVSKYIPVNVGNYNNESLIYFNKLLHDNTWNYKINSASFSDSMLSLYDSEGNFYRGGSYTTHLYNNNIILIMLIDGEFKKKMYFIKNFNDNEIVLENESEIINLFYLSKKK